MRGAREGGAAVPGAGARRTLLMGGVESDGGVDREGGGMAPAPGVEREGGGVARAASESVGGGAVPPAPSVCDLLRSVAPLSGKEKKIAKFKKKMEKIGNNKKYISGY